MLGSCLAFTVLSGLFAAQPVVATRESVAERYGVDVDAVQPIERVRIDKRSAAYVAKFTKDGRRRAIVVTVDGDHFALADADRVRALGIFDLSQQGKLPTALVSMSTLKAQGMAQPVLILRTSLHTAAPKNAKGRRARRGSSEVVLHFISLRGGLQPILRIVSRRRSSDGFGGHRTGGLRIEHKAGDVFVVGLRQDFLPAHRARGLKPPAVEVRYALRY